MKNESQENSRSGPTVDYRQAPGIVLMLQGDSDVSEMLRTFEVQVSGPVGVLGDGSRVDLERMHVVVISRHHDIMPLVVVKGFVRVALH